MKKRNTMKADILVLRGFFCQFSLGSQWYRSSACNWLQFCSQKENVPQSFPRQSHLLNESHYSVILGGDEKPSPVGKAMQRLLFEVVNPYCWWNAPGVKVLLQIQTLRLIRSKGQWISEFFSPAHHLVPQWFKPLVVRPYVRSIDFYWIWSKCPSTFGCHQSQY